MKARATEKVIEGIATSDGAGVRLRRSIGKSPAARVDPFLLLDEFDSNDSADYIAGFPAHPHRGFETVTYMLAGHMLHEDHMGNKGDLQAGDVQWMTAGRGIIHSEMPQQLHGRMHGFQLWLNLPAAEKMKPACYRDIPAEEIPEIDVGAVRVKIIAGQFKGKASTVTGPITGLTTDPHYFDITQQAATEHSFAVPATYAGFIYVYQGEMQLAGNNVRAGQAAVLSKGDTVFVTTTSKTARFLLLAGDPIGEPVVQHGPFVMNSREELEQAMREYSAGTLTG